MTYVYVNLDHLVKVISAAFLHCTFTIFPLNFQINILGECIRDYASILFLFELWPTH